MDIGILSSLFFRVRSIDSTILVRLLDSAIRDSLSFSLWILLGRVTLRLLEAFLDLIFSSTCVSLASIFPQLLRDSLEYSFLNFRELNLIFSLYTFSLNSFDSGL